MRWDDLYSNTACMMLVDGTFGRFGIPAWNRRRLGLVVCTLTQDTMMVDSSMLDVGIANDPIYLYHVSHATQYDLILCFRTSNALW